MQIRFSSLELIKGNMSTFIHQMELTYVSCSSVIILSNCQIEFTFHLIYPLFFDKMVAEIKILHLACERHCVTVKEA